MRAAHRRLDIRGILGAGIIVLLLAIACIAAPVSAQAPDAQRQPPTQQGEFVPLSELPPQDQLPAAPLLVSAYSVVLLAFFFYVLSVARRLYSVQREVDRLEASLKRSGRT